MFFFFLWEGRDGERGRRFASFFISLSHSQPQPPPPQLAHGKPGATDEEIRAAALATNALGFINDLADGLDTRIGSAPGAVQLSGGQRQRLAIARAALQPARVLLLDEATAALDAASEAKVTAGLAALRAGRTSIIVAHRLRTVRDASTIAVVDGGKVVESGGHDALMAAKGAYYQLVSSQVL